MLNYRDSKNISSSKMEDKRYKLHQNYNITILDTINDQKTSRHISDDAAISWHVFRTYFGIYQFCPNLTKDFSQRLILSYHHVILFRLNGTLNRNQILNK